MRCRHRPDDGECLECIQELERHWDEVMGRLRARNEEIGTLKALLTSGEWQGGYCRFCRALKRATNGHHQENCRAARACGWKRQGVS